VTDVVNPITSQPIQYFRIGRSVSENEDEVALLFEKIIQECTETNILIIVDSTTIPNVAENVNSVLERVPRNLKLQNITLINIIYDNTRLVFSVGSLLRKCINIAYSGRFVNRHGYSITPTSYIKNRSFSVTGGGKSAIFRIFSDSPSKGGDLTNQIWFKWYFSIPPCATARVSQSTGTCWMNALVNSMFLSEYTSKLIKSRFSEEEIIPLNSFGQQSVDLESMMKSLVYHLLIKTGKASPSDGNFMGHLATLVKCRYMKMDESSKGCGTIAFGSAGGNVLKGLRVILPTILHPTDFMVVDVSEYSFSSYKELYDRYRKIFEEERSFQKSPAQSDAALAESKEVYNLHKNVATMSLDKIFLTETFRKLRRPRLLAVLPRSKIDLVEEISIGSVRYRIEACVLGLRSRVDGGTHAVCGVICNNRTYVYDSNNFLAESDWLNAGSGGLNDFFASDAELSSRKYSFEEYDCVFYKRV
jgi:hypothetical protein